MCSVCGHEELLKKLEWMLEDRAYSFASKTLTGIQDWVTEKRHATEKQKFAVENIRTSVNTGRKHGDLDPYY